MTNEQQSRLDKEKALAAVQNEIDKFDMNSLIEDLHEIKGKYNFFDPKYLHAKTQIDALLDKTIDYAKGKIND